MKSYMNNNSVSSDEILVLPSSHIGGHEFAGTLISYPKGIFIIRIYTRY